MYRPVQKMAYSVVATFATLRVKEEWARFCSCRFRDQETEIVGSKGEIS